MLFPPTILRRLSYLVLLWFIARRLLRLRKRLAQRTLEDTDAKYIENTIIIQTSCGPIRGFLAKAPDGTVLANFRGIPFAQPPIGPLRWQHAQRWNKPYSSLNNNNNKPFDATRFGYRSVQNPNFGVEFALRSKPYIVFNFLYRVLFLWGLNVNPADPQPLNPNQNEDCLTLNISVRADALTNQQKLPVAVFIHGGGFIMGHASEILYATPYGSPLATKNIVSVSIQYRLGALGWIKVEGGHYNNGLSDVICALEWIRDEISHFNGDPHCVSVYGQSAGAMTIGAMLACPRVMNQRLFHRAILQSGACCNLQSVMDAQRTSKKFIDVLRKSCFPKLTSDDMITAETLSRLDAATLYSAQVYVEILGKIGPIPFLPVVDGDLIPTFPHDLESLASDVDLMIGTTSEECLLFKGSHPFTPFNRWAAVKVIAPFVGPSAVGLESNSQLAQVLAERLVGSVMDRIKNETPHVSDWEAAEKSYFKVASALIFEGPALLLAEKHARTRKSHCKTYRYIFDYRGTIGSVHGIELPFLHGTWDITHLSAEAKLLLGTLIGESSGYNSTKQQEHYELAELMSTLWTNFFITGDPMSSKGQVLDNACNLPPWLPFDNEMRSTLVIKNGKEVVLKVHSQLLGVGHHNNNNNKLNGDEVIIHRDNDEVLHMIVERKASLSGGGKAFGIIYPEGT
jgi:para-nitrobenzyl esterase